MKAKFWSEEISYLKNLKEFYKKINQQKINLWPVMANDVYTYYRNQEDRTKLNKAAIILKSLFMKDNFNINKKMQNKIFATYFMPRKDHQELFHKALEKFSEKEIFLYDGYEYKKSKNFFKYSLHFPDLTLLFNLLKKFKKANLKKILKENYWLFFARTYLRIQQIKEFKQKFEKLSPKAYIAFCSQAFPEETIITQICKEKNIPTFTLEHGFLPNSKDFNPVSIVNENIVSDYVLSWGKRNKEIQKNYIDKKKILLVGNPKYNKIIKKKLRFNPRKTAIFLSVTSNEKSNKDMLKIITQFAKKNPDVKFDVKIHPFDEIKKYASFVDAPNIKFVNKDLPARDLLKKSDFIIVHNTSVAYEALLYNIPIFRFKDKFSLNLWDKFDIFKNEKEFAVLFNKLKNKKNFDKTMEKYERSLKYMFYFEKNKNPSQVYYEKINNILSEKKIKN